MNTIEDYFFNTYYIRRVGEKEVILFVASRNGLPKDNYIVIIK